MTIHGIYQNLPLYGESGKKKISKREFRYSTITLLRALCIVVT